MAKKHGGLTAVEMHSLVVMKQNGNSVVPLTLSVELVEEVMAEEQRALLCLSVAEGREQCHQHDNMVKTTADRIEKGVFKRMAALNGKKDSS